MRSGGLFWRALEAARRRNLAASGEAAPVAAQPGATRRALLKGFAAGGVAAAIPRRYRGVSFDRPPISDMARDMTSRFVVEACREYVADLDDNIDEGRGLWLIGNTGTGKTSLGMVVAKAALAQGKTVGVYFAPKLLTRIRQTFQETESENAYGQLFAKLTALDLLYIDDLGAERRTDWVVEQLYAVINERYEEQRSMLVTSNATSDVAEGQRQLEDQIGSRTVSRLVEICGDPLPLFGPDRRVEARQPRAVGE